MRTSGAGDGRWVGGFTRLLVTSVSSLFCRYTISISSDTSPTNRRCDTPLSPPRLWCNEGLIPEFLPLYGPFPSISSPPCFVLPCAIVVVVLCCAVLCCAVLCCAVLSCLVLSCVVLCCAVLCFCCGLLRFTPSRSLLFRLFYSVFL
ncbi:unnamed protein product [Sphacelaria rigidula]